VSLGYERCRPARILESKGDALTSSWLVGGRKAPEKRALIFGKTME
jgi:hypothetical protein